MVPPRSQFTKKQQQQRHSVLMFGASCQMFSVCLTYLLNMCELQREAKTKVSQLHQRSEFVCFRSCFWVRAEGVWRFELCEATQQNLPGI